VQIGKWTAAIRRNIKTQLWLHPEDGTSMFLRKGSNIYRSTRSHNTGKCLNAKPQNSTLIALIKIKQFSQRQHAVKPFRVANFSYNRSGVIKVFVETPRRQNPLQHTSQFNRGGWSLEMGSVISHSRIHYLTLIHVVLAQSKSFHGEGRVSQQVGPTYIHRTRWFTRLNCCHYKSNIVMRNKRDYSICETEQGEGRMHGTEWNGTEQWTLTLFH
jgi:hypothetical protein